VGFFGTDSFYSQGGKKSSERWRRRRWWWFCFQKKTSCLKISRSIISLHQQLIPTFSLKRKQQRFC
jgi:hypothetical protein